ncbi:hypothetical protein [Rhizobium tumorigenes]|uniref:hypothetical protein n=1 Tax=Rhizobium tumorigenes TaxID=2041385 RepID=UPI00241E76F0|nr:hypothetical protein [Rhizobium tumorigenes]WFS02192.1 hypothetical protein PR016_06150 [Rhizobium tumorigenes]
MPFEQVHIVSTPVTDGKKTGLSVCLEKRAASPAKMKMTVRSDVFSLRDYSEGSCFNVFLGTGEDFGTLRLVSHPNGPLRTGVRKLVRGGRAFTLNLQHRPEFVDRQQVAEQCSFTWQDDDTLDICLPSWAQETNPGLVKKDERKAMITEAARKEAERVRLERIEAERRRAARG